MGAQRAPPAAQRRQRGAAEGGSPDHEPCEAVSARPTRAIPKSWGCEMLRGGPVTTALGAERAGAELSAPDAGSAPRALAAASTQVRARGRPRMLMLLSSPSTYPPDATTPCTRALHAPGGLGGPLGLGELALDEVEPSLPEARVGEVDAHARSQLLGPTRA